MGIDSGTSRVRVQLFEVDSNLVAEASDEPPVERPRTGWASTKAVDLWESCLKAIRSVVAMVEKPDRIRSVAVSIVGESGTIVVDIHYLI